MIRILLVDGQPLFRVGMRMILQQMRECLIVGETDTVTRLPDPATTGPVDVVLLGTSLPAQDLLEAIWRVQQAILHATIILCAVTLDEEKLFGAMRLGVAACCTPYATPEALLAMVQRAAQGQFLLTSDDVFVASSQSRAGRQAVLEKEERSHHPNMVLSTREIEILDAIAHGKSNKEIAKFLKISDQTVKNHITSILKKLLVNDRTAAVVHALRYGWLKIEDIQRVPA